MRTQKHFLITFCTLEFILFLVINYTRVFCKYRLLLDVLWPYFFEFYLNIGYIWIPTLQLLFKTIDFTSSNVGSIIIIHNFVKFYIFLIILLGVLRHIKYLRRNELFLGSISDILFLDRRVIHMSITLLLPRWYRMVLQRFILNLKRNLIHIQKLSRMTAIPRNLRNFIRRLHQFNLLLVDNLNLIEKVLKPCWFFVFINS